MASAGPYHLSQDKFEVMRGLVLCCSFISGCSSVAALVRMCLLSSRLQLSSYWSSSSPVQSEKKQHRLVMPSSAPSRIEIWVVVAGDGVGGYSSLSSYAGQLNLLAST